MLVIGISGSPRAGGNTEICMEVVLAAAAECGVEVEHIRLSQQKIARGCRACNACAETRDGTCSGVKDELNDHLSRIYAADAIVAGSPVYFGSATPEIMALLHRMGYVARRMPENPLAGKVLAGLAVGRRGGQNLTINQLINVGGPLDMTIAGSTYWPMAFGGAPGSVREDKEGMETMAVLGRNIARLIKAGR